MIKIHEHPQAQETRVVHLDRSILILKIGFLGAQKVCSRLADFQSIKLAILCFPKAALKPSNQFHVRLQVRSNGLNNLIKY